MTERQPRTPFPEVSPNLLGEPCTHTFDMRFRGYLMCSQPMCGAMCLHNGLRMSKREALQLIAQLRSEQGD